MREQLRRIKDNHQLILKGDKTRLSQVFGASLHKFKLHPVIEEHELRAYEKKYAFEMPDEFRGFLLEVGNGGAGPFYGIWGIGNSRLPVDPHLYREPSVIVKNFKGRPGEPWQQEILGEGWESLEEDWDKGNMYLAEAGCGAFLYMVMNGPCRGKIFVTDWWSASPRFEEPSTFLDFYEAWQESCITDTGRWRVILPPWGSAPSS